ncbi:hypothetical protein FHG87_015600 [Trinorchestia longiramus]|nr:hypothetical protein FHG87_015600 [Trinorchestia longiramus]
MENTAEESLNGIEVGENTWYLRYLISESDVEVTWEDVAEPLTIIDCAMKAKENESLMFKYTNNVCSIATEGFYDPKKASCEGEEVFIIVPLPVCYTSLGTALTGYKYHEMICETICGSGGTLVDGDGEEVDASSLPDEVLTCCPTETSPCLVSKPLSEVTPCDGVRYCHFLGMTLPEPITDEAKTALDAFRPSYITKPVLVSVVYKDSKWVYMPSNTDVEESDWADPSAIPTTASAVGMNTQRKFVLLTDNNEPYVICQELEDLPKCTDSD